MRIVFVHGINQQGKTPDILRADWLAALGLSLDSRKIDVPFYGDALITAMQRGAGTQATPQGVPTDDDEREFVASALHQMAVDYRLDGEKIAEQQQAIPQGPWDDRRILAILRLLEKISPLHGSVVIKVVTQAYAYLKRDEVADAVDAIVRPAIEAGPCIIISHSLGTVVAFKLLRALKQNVSLFVTLGSPLGLMAVQSALRKPRVKPAGVGRWFNGLDPNDLVTLGKPLTTETFADGIPNKSDIDNGDEPHWSERYLRDTVVRREVADGLKAQGQ